MLKTMQKIEFANVNIGETFYMYYDSTDEVPVTCMKCAYGEDDCFTAEEKMYEFFSNAVWADGYFDYVPDSKVVWVIR